MRNDSMTVFLENMQTTVTRNIYNSFTKNKGEVLYDGITKTGDTMFGYVKVYQPELKMGEFEQYRGAYCALCRTLGKRYGFVAQMTLSYDMTFLALLHLALSDSCVGFAQGRCPYNPFKKRMCCKPSPSLDFAADAAMLLVYHKTVDTITDDRFFKRFAARLILPIMRRNRRRAAEHLPQLDEVLSCAMDEQRKLEEEQAASVDRAAEPTARMLSALCKNADANQDDVLERLGYCLGRWVYLMDAVEDLEEDLRNHSYNPLLLTHNSDVTAAREAARFSLNASMAECRAAYDALTVRRFDGILRNVFEYGMAYIQKQVLSGEKRTRATRRSGGIQNEQSV